MTVRVLLPATLRPFAQGRGLIELPGAPATVAEALEALWSVCPAARDRVLTETGHVREHVQVFVGPESIRYLGGLATAVSPDAELSIVPAVSGG